MEVAKETAACAFVAFSSGRAAQIKNLRSLLYRSTDLRVNKAWLVMEYKNEIGCLL